MVVQCGFFMLRKKIKDRDSLTPHLRGIFGIKRNEDGSREASQYGIPFLHRSLNIVKMIK